jgi:hypothetical protein
MEKLVTLLLQAMRQHCHTSCHGLRQLRMMTM